MKKSKIYFHIAAIPYYIIVIYIIFRFIRDYIQDGDSGGLIVLGIMSFMILWVLFFWKKVDKEQENEVKDEMPQM